MELAERIATLMIKQLRQQLNEAESAELMEWVSRSDRHRDFYEKSMDKDNLLAGIREFSGITDTIRSKIKIPELAVASVTAVPQVHVLRNWGWAAACLLFLAGGTYLYINNNNIKPKDTSIASSLTAHSIPAGTNKAILTLSDGSTIILDSSATGKLANQGTTRILQLNTGSLVYQQGQVVTGTEDYNTIVTPRGGQYQVLLPDGSQVWLNAASSIRFPVAFNGKERKVSITGEAYFEIAKDAKRPFFVNINEQTQIEVLGTRFNVMAYKNENALEATLLDGSIRFRNKNKSVLLTPGRQGKLISGKEIEVLDNVNIEQIIAWKNGMQLFGSADIKTIMRQVERWYDIDVEYQGEITTRQFSGAIPRNAGLSEVLKLLEVNKVNFRVDAANKKLIVMP